MRRSDSDTKERSALTESIERGAFQPHYRYPARTTLTEAGQHPKLPPPILLVEMRRVVPVDHRRPTAKLVDQAGIVVNIVRVFGGGVCRGILIDFHRLPVYEDLLARTQLVIHVRRSAYYKGHRPVEPFAGSLAR